MARKSSTSDQKRSKRLGECKDGKSRSQVTDSGDLLAKLTPKHRRHLDAYGVIHDGRGKSRGETIFEF